MPVLLPLLDWAQGRESRRRWRVPVVGALLAWSITCDPLIEVAGVAPLFFACALRACWIVWSRQVADPGAGPVTPRRHWSSARYELSLAVAALAAIPVAMAGNRVIRHLGPKMARA